MVAAFSVERSRRLSILRLHLRDPLSLLALARHNLLPDPPPLLRTPRPLPLPPPPLLLLLLLLPRLAVVVSLSSSRGHQTFTCLVGRAPVRSLVGSIPMFASLLRSARRRPSSQHSPYSSPFIRHADADDDDRIEENSSEGYDLDDDDENTDEDDPLLPLFSSEVLGKQPTPAMLPIQNR